MQPLQKKLKLIPKPIVGADGDGIDPSVFIDDDGRRYVVHGQGTLRVTPLSAALHVVAWVFVVAGDGIAFGLPVDKVAR